VTDSSGTGQLGSDFLAAALETLVPLLFEQAPMRPAKENLAVQMLGVTATTKLTSQVRPTLQRMRQGLARAHQLLWQRGLAKLIH